MKKHIATLSLGLLCWSQLANAGPFSDDLARCLVDNTTAADRVELARWMFIAFAAHPSVAAMSTVKQADVDAANKETAALFMKLLTESCAEKTKAAVQYEGTGAIQQGFQVLGQVAGMELASNPQVKERMAGFAKGLDEAKLTALLKEPDAKPDPAKAPSGK